MITKRAFSKQERENRSNSEYAWLSPRDELLAGSSNKFRRKRRQAFSNSTSELTPDFRPDRQASQRKEALSSRLDLNHLVGPSSRPLAALAYTAQNLLASPLLNGTALQTGAHLTPDARACVTATYLCVLIVNNTWLDCNLLNVLCNSNRSSLAADSEQEAEQQLLFDRELSSQLKELELALNELIAFTGGGDLLNKTTSGYLNALFGASLEGRAPGGGPREKPAEGHPFVGQTLLKESLLRPPEAEEGEPVGAASTSTAGEREEEGAEWDPERDRERLLEQVGELAKLSRLVEEDKRRIVEYFLRIRRQRKRQQAQLSDERQKLPDESLPVSTSSPPLQSSTTASGYLGSWVSRPLQLVRGWSPQSLWIWPYSGPEQAAADRPAPSQQEFRPAGGIQLLRPVDRTELFGELQAVANQSAPSSPLGVAGKPPAGELAKSDQQAYAASGQLMLEQQLDKSGLHQPVESANLLLAGHSNNHNYFPTSQTSKPKTFGDLLIGAGVGAINLSDTSPGATTTPVSRIATAFSSGAEISSLGGRQESNRQQWSSKLQALARNQAQLAAGFPQQARGQQYAQQVPPAFNQQQPPDVQADVPECKCNDLLLDFNQHDCRFRCSVPAQPVEKQLPAMSFGQVSTATAPAQPPPTSAGKMNPLDVTFSLYTRYHRELANEMAISVAQAGSAASLLPAASTQSSAGAVATTAQSIAGSGGGGGLKSLASTAATNLIQFGEAIELAVNESQFIAGELQHFNSSLPIKIIIHGFGSGGRRPWVSEMVYKFLKYEDVNVIVVDWEKGATLPNYVLAAGNTRLVGHKIACLIKSLNKRYGLTGNSYHLIGFSLGAHVAGFAGMEMRGNSSANSSANLLNRITGLDPASPLFEGYEANDRLDLTDAKFVDVVHSNGDGVLRGGFGSLQPMGHVDFYPNGGRVQVGCNSVLLSALSDIIYGKWQSLCNHRRALNFFMDSFEFDKCRFRSFNCDSYDAYLRGECFDCGSNNDRCSYMGYLANYSKGRGKMYLTTHEEAPFCANQFIIRIIGSKGFRQNQWGKVEVTLVTVDGKNESFWLSSINQQTTHHELALDYSLAGGSALNSVPAAITHGAPAGSSQLMQAAPLKEPVIVSQHSMQSLIVARPSLINITQVLLRYTKYKGWIYSGDESWSIDKVFITDSDGQVKSFCGFNTVLESQITSRLKLEPGNCSLASESQQPSGQLEQAQPAGQRTGRLFANHNHNNLISAKELSKGYLTSFAAGSSGTRMAQPPAEQLLRPTTLSVPFPYNTNTNQLPFLAAI